MTSRAHTLLVPSTIGWHILFVHWGLKLEQLLKTARKHQRFIEDLGDDVRVTPGFGFYLRAFYISWAHAKPSEWACQAADASARHEISHMRRRYSAMSRKISVEVPFYEPSNDLVKPPQATLACFSSSCSLNT